MGILVHGPTAHPELPAPWTPNAFNWDWPMELDSWTWPGSEGMAVGVRVFARGCESARLMLDGQKLAESQFNLSNLTATFVVPFAPGKLEAICINASEVVPNISASLTSAGVATQLRLSADRYSLRGGDPNDLSYVTIEVLDSEGVTVPTAAVAVNISLRLSQRSDEHEYSSVATEMEQIEKYDNDADGEEQSANVQETGAELQNVNPDFDSPDSEAAAAAAVPLSIEAVGSGDPSDPSSFTSSTRTTWRGRAIAILRPTLVSPSRSPTGDRHAVANGNCTAWKHVEITATASGLTSGKLTIILCPPGAGD